MEAKVVGIWIKAQSSEIHEAEIPVAVDRMKVAEGTWRAASYLDNHLIKYYWLSKRKKGRVGSLP